MTAPNPMKGEVALGEHTLAVTFNSMCSLEAATGNKVPGLLQQMQDGLGFSEVRLWVRVLLTSPMSEEEAGELVGSIGYEATLKALGRAMEGFFAPAAKERKPNPPKA